MSLGCNCPPSGTLTEIPSQLCDVNMGQIVRVAFQRRQASAPFVEGTNPISEKASWDAFMGASDDTKIVITSDNVSNPTIEAGEAVTFGGGDNSTAYGTTLITDGNPSTFSVDFLGQSREQIEAMQELVCESSNLTCYFINNSGQIIASFDGTDYAGFKVEAPFVGDSGNQGYGSFDTTMMTFQLPYGWSKTREIVDPATGFDPRYDL